MDERPHIAITMGDPAGIGPEVIAKALRDSAVYEQCRPFVIGNADATRDAQRLVGNGASTRTVQAVEDVVGQLGSIDVLDIGNLEYGEIAQGSVSAAAGRASVEWIHKAGDLASEGQIQAIVTAPINKEASSLAGFKDIGHMEILQRRSGATEVATVLMAERLRVVHLTTHKSLRVACDYVTKENVLSMIVLTDKSLREWGFPTPRIGVAALNPHASDGGLIGDEEEREIAPAVDEARAQGIDATGPVPPPTRSSTRPSTACTTPFWRCTTTRGI